MISTSPAVMPSAGVRRSNETEAASPIAANAANSRKPFKPDERQPVDGQLVEHARDRRADRDPEDRRQQAEGDERERRDRGA